MAQLGVAFIPCEDALQIPGYDTLPSAEIYGYDSENTQYTSRRLVSTYRGQHYELQIVEAVPKNKHSHLRRPDVDVPVTEQQIVAGVTEIIKNVGVSALGSVPVPAFNAAVTFLDTVFSIGTTVIETIQPSTIIECADGVALVSLSTHMKTILVKPYEAADKRQGIFI